MEMTLPEGLTLEQFSWLSEPPSTNGMHLPPWATSYFIRQVVRSLETDVPKQAEAWLPALNTLARLAGTLAETESQLQALLLCAKLHWVCSEYREAQAYVRKAREIALNAHLWQVVAECYRKEGAASQQMGQLSEAEQLYKQALNYFEQTGDILQCGICLFNLGLLSSQRGEPENALDLFSQAQQRFENIQDRLHLGLCYLNRGNIYSETGRLSEALASLEQARTVFESNGDRRRVGTCLHQTAGIYGALGKIHECRWMYEQARLIFEELGDRRRVALCYLNAAQHIYSRVEHFHETLALYDKASEVLESLNEWRGVGACLLRKAEILSATHRIPEARECYSRALGILQSIGDKVASTYAELGLVSLATETPEPDAIDRLMQLATILEEASDYYGLATAWKLIGDHQSRMGDPAAAIESYKQALQKQEFVWQSLTDPFIAAGTSRINESLPACLAGAAIKANAVEPVFPELQRARSSVLQEILSGARASIQQTSANEIHHLNRLRAEYEAAARELSKTADSTRKHLQAQKRMENLLLELNTYEDRLHSRSFSGLQQTGNTGQSDIARYLDAHTAILEIFASDEGLCLILIRRKGGELTFASRLVPVQRKQLFEDIVNFANETAAGADTTLTRSASRELYRLLIAPIASSLHGVTTLIICPDQALYLLPFAALQDRQGRYLIQKWVPVIAPSGSAWAMCRKLSERKTRNLGQPLLVGVSQFNQPANSFLGTASLPDLPFVRQELAQINAILGDNTVLLADEQATLHNVCGAMSSASLLHFATHAIPNSVAPLMSILALAPQPDGTPEPLYAREICQMSLSASLTVLSACNTLGEHTAGEGFLGLGWSFLTAGCPTTLSTRWEANDEATACWTAEFYKHYVAGHGKAESYRQACLQLLNSERFRLPAYWACWQLIGSDL